MAGMEEVLERLVTDPQFRSALQRDPKAALAGYHLSEGDIDVLSAQLDPNAGASGHVEQRTSKSGLAGVLGGEWGGQMTASQVGLGEPEPEDLGLAPPGTTNPPLEGKNVDAVVMSITVTQPEPEDLGLAPPGTTNPPPAGPASSPTLMSATTVFPDTEPPPTDDLAAQSAGDAGVQDGTSNTMMVGETRQNQDAKIYELTADPDGGSPTYGAASDVLGWYRDSTVSSPIPYDDSDEVEMDVHVGKSEPEDLGLAPPGTTNPPPAGWPSGT